MRSLVFRFSLTCVVVASILPLAGCGTVVLDTLSTTVAPLSSEDLSAPCRYDMLLPGSTTQKAVLVIFERGDSVKLFEDADLRAMTTDLHIATVFARQCNSIQSGDLQSDAAKGPARALFAALTQLSVLSEHPELAQVPVIPYGFSAAGALAITLTHAEPGRVLGAIPYAAGSDWVNLEQLQVTGAAAQVPMLIMANSLDPIVGTHRTLNYFDRGRALGAPWAFAVQNGMGHCCNLTAKPLIMPWIRAIAASQTAAATAKVVNFHCGADGVTDSYGTIDCKFTSSSLGAPASSAQESGMLPDSESSDAWLAWVNGPG